MSKMIYTVGHSNLKIETFLTLLNKHGVTAVCDVRSSPYSRVNPQYNRDTIRRTLFKEGIRYVFLGAELGARSENPDCYVNGKVQYHLLAQQETFRAGIERVERGVSRFTVALMCAEHDPMTCHRAILVCRQLKPIIDNILHIRSDSSIETQSQMELRMLEKFNLYHGDILSGQLPVELAYEKQGQKIGYSKVEPQNAYMHRQNIG